MGMHHWRKNLSLTQRLGDPSRSKITFREALCWSPVAPMDLSDVLASLSIREIREAVHQLSVPAPCRKKKDVLTSFVLGNLTPEVEKSLCDKLVAQTSTAPGTPLRKRKRDEPQPTTTRKSSRIDVLSRRIVYSIYYNSTLLLPVRGEGKGY